MSFGHEKLDVYRAAIEYLGWAYRYPDEYGAGRTIPIPTPTPMGMGQEIRTR